MIKMLEKNRTDDVVAVFGDGPELVAMPHVTNGFFGGVVFALAAVVPLWGGAIWVGMRLLYA